MQPPPLLCCRRASLITLRMLSSCASQNPNSSSGVPSTMRTSSKTSQASHLPILSNLKISQPNPQNLHQSTIATKSLVSVSNYQIPSIHTSSDPEASAPSEIDGSQQQTLIVVSFYKFADFPDHADLRKPLKDLCEEERVSGGIILAPEGINGSICGTREAVKRVLGFIQSDSRLKGLRRIESPVSPEEEAIHHGHTSSSPVGAGEDAPFRWDHVRVKLKKEIVSLGMPTVSPIERVGKYVSPRDWNALITDPDTVVIDVRNMYEIRCGKFKGAIDPCTTAFREFPPWVDNKFQIAKSSGEESQAEAECTNESTNKHAIIQEQKKLPRVAMYCTGGIRCEKASSFLLSKGFKEVYHLEGGILKYLEEIPEEDSLWEGECFVFDKRVSVEHGLVQGSFKLCYGCKQPVTDADMESPEWECGVSCSYCFSTKSEEEKERARARQRQYKEWGIIGGPHKGRRSIRTDDDDDQKKSFSAFKFYLISES